MSAARAGLLLFRRDAREVAAFLQTGKGLGSRKEIAGVRTALKLLVERCEEGGLAALLVTDEDDDTSATGPCDAGGGGGRLRIALRQVAGIGRRDPCRPGDTASLGRLCHCDHVGALVGIREAFLAASVCSEL